MQLRAAIFVVLLLRILLLLPRMTFFTNRSGWNLACALGLALALAGCMGGDVDDTTGSRLVQPPPSGTPQPPIEAGDIAIAGQDFAHSVCDLPGIADAPKPPLVQFTGVTSIINGPVDTEPYTDLLRDRLLLGTREKLRFVERTLPPLVTTTHKLHHKEKLPPDVLIDTNPDYQVLAELRGKYEDDLYRIQIQLVDFNTGAVVFDAVYHIRKEAPSTPEGETTITTQTIPAPGTDAGTPPTDQTQAPPPPDSSATGSTPPTQ